LEQIKLNKENPKIEFKLNSKDSYLLIQSVFITSQNNFENEWTNFISTVKLTAELRYIVFVDPEGRFMDDRKKQFPIPFIPDLCQDQPVFHLNTLIKNEAFTLGINPERKFFQKLKLEIQDVENLDQDYTLEFTIEKFGIDA
jgi:hypothetical protein